jgi:hypothetical protein
LKWRQGWNESSRVWSRITPNEKASERIDLGFHIFLNKKDALTVTIGNCGAICRKVYFKLEENGVIKVQPAAVNVLFEHLVK